MKAFYTMLFFNICLFYACQEKVDFEAFEENQCKDSVVFNNHIRFDRLAVGQKSWYHFFQQTGTEDSLYCLPTNDTLSIEIIEQDTNGYLVKELTNIDGKAPLFYYLQYKRQKILIDSQQTEPSVDGQEELFIRTKYHSGVLHYWDSSRIFGTLGAKFYLKTPTYRLKETIFNDACHLFYLSERKDDSLPDRTNCHHSELGFTRNYAFEKKNYCDILLITHDYCHRADGPSFNYGFTQESGIIFSSFHRVSTYSRVWHIIPDQ